MERFVAGSSPLHHLDARIKVIITLVLIVSFVLTPAEAWPAYPLLWAVIGSLAAAGQLGVGRVALRGAVALPFMLAALPLIFTTPGQPLLTVFGSTASEEGLARVIAILLKSWLSVQAALILTMTTPFSDLLWALTSLRVPRTLVIIMGFMYRYLFIPSDEAHRLLRARSSRSAVLPGSKAGGGLIWRGLVAGSMIGNLFVRSYERSDRVYTAMLARGYQGQMRISNPPPLTRRSLVWGALPIVAVILIQLMVLWWSR